VISTAQKRNLANDALHKAINTRRNNNLSQVSPIDIYSLCEKLKIKVRFVDVNMEGMYRKGSEPKIFVSALRPLARRAFTCAHELGHHVFEHGSTIDELTENLATIKSNDPQEYIVNTFASFLLMPALGIRKAFNIRGWEPRLATPLQIFTISCNFGVGYETLVNHMAYTLKMISRQDAECLLKTTPQMIRNHLIGQPSTNPLVIVDRYWELSTIDIEVGSNILLPLVQNSANEIISFQQETATGYYYKAEKPGITRVRSVDSEWAAFVRVAKYQFIGLSSYRHLEDSEDD
jgi:Zn-dependent peptidase ImmA (M78 family)